MIIGLDMGGTHIDGVIIKNNQVINTIKKLTDKEDLFNSIWTTLEELLRGYDKSKIKRINLSTTVSTNAIVEEKTSAVGMIIQSGPGVNNDFSSCNGEIQTISGYVDHRGVVVENLDIVEIQRAIELFKEKELNSCAVVSKFSTRNPHNELSIGEMLEKDFHTITLGHRMSGKLNFPRRVYTSYLNSAVHSTFKGFSTNIKKSLKKEGINSPLYILKADGGTMDIKTAEERPVETILSGPAASFMGISALLNTDDDAILLDIGGTTTDIFFLADGVPLFEPLGAEISEYNTLVRAIYSVSIGLGGDSGIRIEDNKIKIGPRRMGKPYALGGPNPTPTDAMIYLELMEIPEDSSKEKAKKAMELLGKELNITAKEVAELILNTMSDIIKKKTDELLFEINSKPVYTVKELLHGKQIKPKTINVIGGPANVLSPILEKHFKLPCYFPVNYHVANAIGAALAKPTMEITMLADTSQGILSVSELGVYEKIPKSYTLNKAKKRAMDLLKSSAISMGAKEDTIESEITEESSFNMVEGFYTKGKNIRIKAQIKPGHILKLRSDGENES
ncbi:MAG TPA: hydantoinase/oxoprolinase family protein [Tissierellaceae bacterium]|nr:hydantoinase/oxoprolinase family protein [Tissierellaceae bacterium]